MRPFNIAGTLLASGLLTSQAQLIPVFRELDNRLTPPADRPYQHQERQRQQLPMGPGIQLPTDDPPSSGPPDGDVILSDVIGSQRAINIFAGFARDVDSVNKRLDTSSANTTVLAPLNSAISDLPRKPWEDPKDYNSFGANAYNGKAGEDRASANLRRFTEAHVIPVSPWKEGEKVSSMAGGDVWWTRKGGKAYVQPGSVEVDRVVSQVANGELWVLKGVLNYAS